jgi:c-di-GMP-binding flagellar brake protein YcgR
VNVEKRRERRVPLGTGCWLVHMDEVSCFDTLDVSGTGMSVLISDPLPVGKQVNLQFFTPDSANPVKVAAEVVWSSFDQDQGSMGLRFLELDETTEKVVREFGRLLRLQKRFPGSPHPGE